MERAMRRWVAQMERAWGGQDDLVSIREQIE